MTTIAIIIAATATTTAAPTGGASAVPGGVGAATTGVASGATAAETATAASVICRRLRPCRSRLQASLLVGVSERPARSDAVAHQLLELLNIGEAALLLA